MLERTAHAKINLALHVTGQRPDGYHLLDSIVVFAEYGDIVSVSRPHHAHGPIEVAVSGPFSESLTGGGYNLVTSAAVLLREQAKRLDYDPEPVSIHLRKNLPVASGLGGGSADAAATLLSLRDYWGLDLDLKQFARVLGADVMMCLHSKPLRARGIGDEIKLFENASAFAMLLVNPGVEISTPRVFSALENKEQSEISSSVSTDLPNAETLAGLRNDLELPAVKLAPAIRTVLSSLAQTGAKLTRMSGSGATCFGLYETMAQAESAREAIIKANSEWWCVATLTTVP